MLLAEGYVQRPHALDALRRLFLLLADLRNLLKKQPIFSFDLCVLVLEVIGLFGVLFKDCFVGKVDSFVIYWFWFLPLEL